MTWTYSGDPGASDVDAVRFWLTDTDEHEPFFSNEELSYLVEAYAETLGSLHMVAAMAADTLANRFAREITVSGDSISVDASSLQERFAAVASRLRQMDKDVVAGEGFYSDFSGTLAHGFDPTLAPLNFGLGMNDNPEAGRQEMGRPSWYGQYDYEDDGVEG